MEVASLFAFVLYTVQPIDSNMQELHLMLSSGFSKSNVIDFNCKAVIDSSEAK